MKIRYIFPIFVIFVLVYMFFFLIYDFEIKTPLKMRNNINEILKLKIDSCHIQKFDDSATYQIYISGKYKATIYYVEGKPFEKKEARTLFITDINGDIILSSEYLHYDRLGDSFWKKDMDKLINYFNTYINKQLYP